MKGITKQLRQIHRIINRAKIGYAIIMLLLLTVLYCYNVPGDSTITFLGIQQLKDGRNLLLES